MKKTYPFLLIILLVVFAGKVSFAQCPTTNLGPELICNGDFEQGDTCFTSQYTYSNAVAGVPASIPTSGQYKVEPDPGVYLTNSGGSGWYSNWVCNDHTFGMPGVGNMLFFNGQTFAPCILWESQVNVQAGKKYIFGCWLNNIVVPTLNRQDANYELLINGVQHVPPTLCDELPDVWVWVCNTYTATTTGPITLTIRTWNTAQSGADGAIDDITFREYSCPRPPNPQTPTSNSPQCGSVILTRGTPPPGDTWYWQGTTCDTTKALGSGVNYTVTTSGTYCIRAWNSCGWSDSCRCVTVVVNPNPTANAGPDKTICNKDTATLTASAVGGGGSYQYSWSNGGSTATITVNPGTATNYTVTVIDANGCSDTDDVLVSLYTDPVADAGLGVSLCQGVSTTLTAAGAGGGTYRWNTTATTSSITITPTTTTTYTVTVTDVNGCTDSDNVIIIVNPNPTVNAGPDVGVCVGDSVVLTAIVTGGGGGNQYKWNTGPTTNSITVYPATPTVYTITVTDANNCTDSDDVLVAIIPNPTANAGLDQTICNGDTATLGATGGPSYLWNTTEMTDTIMVTPTTTTTYTVTVGQLGTACTGTDEVIVYVNPSPTANAGADTAVCDGFPATLKASGAGPGGSYVWSTGGSTSSIVVIPTTTTTYTVTVTNANTCTDTDEIIVTLNPNPTANAGPDTAICNGFPANLNASATGGAGGYQYSWNTGPSTASITVTPTTTTNYDVIVTDANGCTDSDQVTVTVYSNPVVSAGSNVAICDGDSTTLTASGVTNGMYVWNTNDSVAQITVGPVVNTTYTVTATDASGCTGTDNVVVTVNALPIANAGPDVTMCESDPPPILTASGAGAGTYLWNLGYTTASITITNPSLGSTTYTVTVTDANTCTDSDEAIVTVYQNPIAEFTFTPETGSMQQPIITFIDGSTGAVQWNWNFGDMYSPANSSTLQNPTHEYASAGVYDVCLTVFSAENCMDSVCKRIIMEQDFTFYAPNAFTPDGDGINEEFLPKGYGWDTTTYQMYIFDRWGEEIFVTNHTDEGWNGKVKNRGEEVQVGVYSWLVRLKEEAGLPHEFVGMVTVIR